MVGIGFSYNVQIVSVQFSPGLSAQASSDAAEKGRSVLNILRMIYSL